MVRYQKKKIVNPAKTCKAIGSDLRVSFKARLSSRGAVRWRVCVRARVCEREAFLRQNRAELTAARPLLRPSDCTRAQNTRETAAAIKGKNIDNAVKYLNDVVERKQAVPFRVYRCGIGRHAQAKMHHLNTACRWPVKSCKFLLSLLQNVKSNAEVFMLILNF